MKEAVKGIKVIVEKTKDMDKQQAVMVLESIKKHKKNNIKTSLEKVKLKEI
jgi:hypothetical protein